MPTRLRPRGMSGRNVGRMEIRSDPSWRRDIGYNPRRKSRKWCNGAFVWMTHAHASRALKCAQTALIPRILLNRDVRRLNVLIDSAWQAGS